MHLLLSIVQYYKIYVLFALYSTLVGKLESHRQQKYHSSAQLKKKTNFWKLRVSKKNIGSKDLGSENLKLATFSPTLQDVMAP